MTKIHELLGVGMDEEFEVKDRDFAYKLDENGALMRMGSGYWYPSAVYTFAALINNPSLIIRKQKLTEEQQKVLEALWTLGFNWVAKDKSGDVYGYVGEPRHDDYQWIGYGTPFHVLSCLVPLLPDWTKPLDTEKTLKEAQQ